MADNRAGVILLVAMGTMSGCGGGDRSADSGMSATPTQAAEATAEPSSLASEGGGTSWDFEAESIDGRSPTSGGDDSQGSDVDAREDPHEKKKDGLGIHGSPPPPPPPAPGKKADKELDSLTPQASELAASVAKTSFSREAVQQVIRDNVDVLRACYEQTLTEDPTLEGSVTVSFGIDGNGSVLDLESERSGLNDDVESCVGREIEGLAFPPTEDGGVVRIRYPLQFQPS